MAQGGFAHLKWGGIDKETFLEVTEFRHIWKKDAAVYLLKNKDWGLFMMHIHTPDFLYHYIFNQMNPKFAKDGKEVELYREAELGIYQSIDRLIAGIIDVVDTDTLIIIVSGSGSPALE